MLSSPAKVAFLGTFLGGSWLISVLSFLVIGLIGPAGALGRFSRRGRTDVSNGIEVLESENLVASRI